MAASVKRVFALPAKLKENKDYYRYSPYSKNLIAAHEDCLFIWHAVEEHILVVTFKEKNSSDDQEPQILTLSTQPSFTVEELTFSPCGHHLALSGKNGLLVVELPRRWGGTQFHGAGFEGGKDVVLCKSWNIAQRLFSCNRHVQICHVAWYPGCPSGSHILVLCSDNNLRMYNVLESQTPLCCIPICDTDQSLSATHNSIYSRMHFPNTTAALGDTAVSFDFGPACSLDDENFKNEQEIVWPIFILKGNGDVCLINSSMKNMRGRGPKVQGPLTMHPPAEDNYGADACSIACLQTVPPVLVIATCAGILYHCVALRNPDSQSSEDTQSWNPLNEGIAEMDLYVYESVELSISLTQPAPEDELFSCPIRLSLDPSLKIRYHCTHSAGVHAVVMPNVPELEKFSSQEESAISQDFLLELLDSAGQESLVEHLVCTQPFPSSAGNPILGLAISCTISGSFLVCLMSTWDALLLPLSSSFSLMHHNHFLPEENLDSETDGISTDYPAKESDSLMASVLMSFQGSSYPPLVKTDPSGVEPSPQKCIELLSNVTQSLREERIQRLQIAHTQMQKRVNMLRSQKVQMLGELATIGQEQMSLREKAEALAERYEDIGHKQQQLTKKVECALSLLERRMPFLSDSEVSMQKELHTVEERLKHLENLLQQAQLKMDFKTNANDLRNQIREENNFEKLGSSNQMKQVKEAMAQQGVSVSNLVRKMNVLMKNLGL